MTSSPDSLPLLCISPNSLDKPTLGEPCEGCPQIRMEQVCDALEAGQLIVAQQLEMAANNITIDDLQHELSTTYQDIEALHETIDTLVDRLVDIRTDTLVSSSFTPEGLQDLIAHDQKLQYEIVSGSSGLIRLDGRFVGLINTFGNRVGDDFLATSGETIADAAASQVRLSDRREDSRNADGNEYAEEPLDRLGHPGDLDIVCRQGGDEFVLIIRNVSLQTLAVVANRIAERLGVQQAIAQYEQGEPPFIASVGTAHFSEINATTRTQLADDPWELFNRANALADEVQLADKNRQYEQMWTFIQAAPATTDIGLTKPANHREIADLFLQYVCPSFYNNPTAYLTRDNQ